MAIDGMKELLERYANTGKVVELYTPTIRLRGKILEVGRDFVKVIASNFAGEDDSFHCRTVVVSSHFITHIDETAAEEITSPDGMEKWYQLPPQPEEKPMPAPIRIPLYPKPKKEDKK